MGIWHQDKYLCITIPTYKRQMQDVRRGLVLTNIVQVQAVRVVADQALQERIAVLGSAIASLHDFPCPENHTITQWYKHHKRSRHLNIGTLDVRRQMQHTEYGTFPQSAMHGFNAPLGICCSPVRDVCTPSRAIFGCSCAVRSRSAHRDLHKRMSQNLAVTNVLLNSVRSHAAQISYTSQQDADLYHFAKLAKVLRAPQHILIAELQRQAHNIHQIPLHHSDVLHNNILDCLYLYAAYADRAHGHARPNWDSQH